MKFIFLLFGGKDLVKMKVLFDKIVVEIALSFLRYNVTIALEPMCSSKNGSKIAFIAILVIFQYLDMSIMCGVEKSTFCAICLSVIKCTLNHFTLDVRRKFVF